MFGKPRDVITAHRCERVEMIRLALEVLTGQRVRIKHLDFDNGEGAIYLGRQMEEMQISFVFTRGLDIWFKHMGSRLVAMFEDHESVMIEDLERGPNGQPMVWVGVSHVERERRALFDPNLKRTYV